MITFKGSPLVKGKRFIKENDILEYKGKVFTEFHEFINQDNTSIILTEQEALSLKPYKLNEHSLIEEQDNSDDLYQVVTSYTDKQLNMLSDRDNPTLLTDLLNSFQEEINKLSSLGLAYQTSITKFNGTMDELFDAMESYLKNVQRNISETSLPNIYVQLNSFIYNLQKAGEL